MPLRLGQEIQALPRPLRLTGYRTSEDERRIGFSVDTARVMPSTQGNLGGNAQRTRHIFNKAFLEALAKDFQEGGAQAIAKVRKEQPAAYMKICALLVPKEFKLEHTGGVKSMTDEELEQAIALLKTMIAARAGEAAKVIEGEAEEVSALLAPLTPTKAS